DRQGHTFLLCSRNDTLLQEFAIQLQARFPRTKVMARAADLSVKKEVEEWVAWAAGQTGQIDLLVNNAGTFIPGTVAEEEDGALETMMATNLYSAYHLTRGLLPLMLPQKSGHIFNICSVASLHAYPDGGAY